MRTLHFGLRVRDLDLSLAFYTAVGYEVVGEVRETGMGHLTMLKLPADEFVTIELVHQADEPPVGGGSLGHFVIQVESMDETVTGLGARGIEVEPPTSPNGSAEFRTSWVADPDGNRIELVQWPRGHAPGMTSNDFHR